MHFKQDVLIENEKQNIDGGGNRVGGRTTDVMIFDSMKSAAERAIEGVKKLGVSGCHMHLQNSRFTGRTFDSANALRDAVSQKWNDGADLLDRMIGDLEKSSMPQPRSRRRVRKFDEFEGEEVDLDRLRSGLPFWRRTVRDNRNAPTTITICTEVSANSEVTPNDVLWRGAAAVALTLLLERAGYRVELWVYANGQRVYEDGTDLLIACNLKNPGDPLDRTTLVNSVAAWFYRTILFALKAYSPEAGRTATGGLGRPKPLDQGHLSEITSDEKVIVIEQAFSYNAAIELVREKIEALGLAD